MRFRVVMALLALLLLALMAFRAGVEQARHGAVEAAQGPEGRR
jgi:hypothetical protein